ncbi:molybdopterin-dependent oxidoreductase [Paraburkholderia sp. GAS42]|jgi:DMSO/TMAO reductase YedYZ molybdopterin-dependent catalytic subunit|uniref:molybdopterin-dependent oxidoreductase n=1 Tax=Paraburkholderia sp. GAS42 TaxID=3035135 RepID=UPI003D1DA6E9
MALFVVRHQHAAERCPAHDPYMGAMLLNHLSRPNVRRHGVEIRGEAVVQGEHTLYLIVEAEDEGHLREFMKPFQMVGSLDIYPASTCARVVASGGCGAALPVSELVPALDPETACQNAIEAGLVVHRAHPLNCETSIPALIGGVVMPNAHFYVRNHFQIPDLDPAAFRLAVGGLVERQLNLSLRDLHNMPSQTRIVTLECAGNGRTKFDPPIEGEKWDLGAVSTAEWTGVTLAEVLDRAGVRTGATEVMFRGADGGTMEGHAGPLHFERSLQLGHARDPDVLLAYAMNGEPLPVQHGYPVRLVVPGWYAVASVKWLTDIELIDWPFAGHYQADKYWYEWERDGQTVREPVTLQHVRALITEPARDQEVRRGELAIRGVAWSGAAQIARVDISVGGGSWQEARLVSERKRHSWQWWELITRAHEPGVVTLRVRATDLAGRTQPEHAEWNRLGYGNNVIHEVPVRIV